MSCTSREYGRSPVNVCGRNGMGTLSTPFFTSLPLKYQLPNQHLQLHSLKLPLAQTLTHLGSIMDFPIFHQPESLVPVSGTTTHPPRPEVGFILNQPPLPPPQIPCFGSPSYMEMFYFHSCCTLKSSTLPLDRPFPNTDPPRIQPFTPARQTSLLQASVA